MNEYTAPMHAYVRKLWNLIKSKSLSRVLLPWQKTGVKHGEKARAGNAKIADGVHWHLPASVGKQ